MSDDPNQRRTYPFKAKRAVVRMKRVFRNGIISGIVIAALFFALFAFRAETVVEVLLIGLASIFMGGLMGLFSIFLAGAPPRK